MWDGSVVQPESIDPEADVDRRVLLRNGVSWGYALRPLLQLDLVVQSFHRVLVLARGCLRGCNNHMSHCREWWVGFSLISSKLEPKWQSHFGNFIDNTSLALHKFQAKSEFFCLGNLEHILEVHVGAIFVLLGTKGGSSKISKVFQGAFPEGRRI